MREHRSTPKAHLLVCCRKREGKANCADKGALEIVDQLKSELKKEGLHKTIKVSQSSCLGECERGITAALYPEGRWWTEVTPENILDLLNLLKGKAT